MMLRVSATTTDTEIALQGVVGDKASAATGIAYGAELMHFAESIALRDEKVMAESRKALLGAAGPAVLVDAAGVAANFQRMVRIAIPLAYPLTIWIRQRFRRFSRNWGSRDCQRPALYDVRRGLVLRFLLGLCRSLFGFRVSAK